MTLSMRRIVLFTKAMPRMVVFYRDVLGLRLAKDEKGWKEFDANGCIIALHNGTSVRGKRPPKLGFWAEDVAAARAELVGRGAKMTKILGSGLATRCEGKDPDGNPFYVSVRE
jgi:catechol 2,3-dioxygenase-like lactoylglutathione lyase family enzyme